MIQMQPMKRSEMQVSLGRQTVLYIVYLLNPLLCYSLLMLTGRNVKSKLPMEFVGTLYKDWALLKVYLGPSVGTAAVASVGVATHFTMWMKV